MIGHSDPKGNWDCSLPLCLLNSLTVVLFGVGMMNQQQDARRAAAQAFYESLEQLQQTLESAETTAAPPPVSNHTVHSRAKTAETEADLTNFDLNVWAEAIADIDQFIQAKNAPEES
ncbi:MAG: hypothetical protein NW224_25840 [Leptolyngbyaceae cyanobacterium bins.302]|nr:hypothetical protein [Leptolyngbyaceae cyanobacterium bins.302]